VETREEFEYIVVGTGAGGGPLAANLAAAGHRVLLLEAGGHDGGTTYEVPAFHASSSEEPSMSWEFFVRHYADEERQLRDWKYKDSERSREEGGVFYPRAGTLGGCTAHNAMIFSYPTNSDWQGIADLTGDESWRPKKMRKYFQRLEDCRYRCIQRLLWKLTRLNPSRHGYRGWLASEEADPSLLFTDKSLYRLIRNAAIRNLLASRHFFGRLWAFVRTFGDPNDWGAVKASADGLRQTPLNTRGGRRTGSRERVLWALENHPEQLTLRTHALVSKVLVEEQGGRKRAVGVEYLKGAHLYTADPNHDPAAAGVRRTAYASREVILSGGAFNTPQILQLSGIGPRVVLEEAGVPLVHELPGVGRNLQDRYEVSVVFEMKEPFEMLEGALMRPPEPGDTVVDPAFRAWQDGRGIYTTNGAVVSILRRSRDELPNPDLFLFALVSDFRGYFPGYSELVRDARKYLTWAVLKGHTLNRAGEVRITSADPQQRPHVDFRYFDAGDDPEKVDRDAVVRGLEIIGELTRSYDHLIEARVQPEGALDDKEAMRRYVEDTAWGHHASCTCPIGKDGDPMAVLDSRFRVRGIDGLRVVDASVFPRIPGLFIVSAVYMIAEKASDVILEDAR